MLQCFLCDVLKIWPNINKEMNKVRFFSRKVHKDMKFLNVAEKNDAAKTISGLLSNGTARRREGLSVYNKIYEFDANVCGKNSKMVMTSVSGHLLSTEFLMSYKNWQSCDPLQLFDAGVRRNCIENFIPIKKTLEREIKTCQGLIIWTDCDREGESIGFEIIDVCKAIKPNITVYRAKFSEITNAAVRRALNNLKQPNKFLNDAVIVRTELDLRTGAAITRLQTMRLQRLFPEKMANKLISYGSCQIPTLGFVVERYKEVEAFVSEPFWKIKVTHTINDLTVEFNWARNRLFDKESCEDYLMLCLADPKAKVENVTTKPKNKWRPMPMDTVELEKLGSRKLKLSAKETMTIAEKLYTQGIISYPRTETNMFSKEIDLRKLVEQHLPHSDWGDFARKVIEWGPNPRNGNKSDQAHPPIHPTKIVKHLTGNEGRVYELITRHFLATVSKDATGSETIVNVDIASEKFNATGLCIYERNYLDVYVYEKWNAKQIHKYEIAQLFDPDEITMQEGATTAPPLLTEADLIALMEKHGIGTDATHADHINTIKERGYIGEVERGCLVPGVIGMGLYEAYDAMDLVLAKPLLRAEFEADLKKICCGEKDPKEILQDQIQKYKEAYKVILSKITAMDEKIALRINETPVEISTNEISNENESHIKEFFTCPKCLISPMALKRKKTSGWFLGCLNFPECKNAVWLNEELKEVSASDEKCRCCNSRILKVKLTSPYYRNIFDVPDGLYETCLWCDNKFRETFNINVDQVKKVGAIVGDTTLSRNTSGSIVIQTAKTPQSSSVVLPKNENNTKNKPKPKTTMSKQKNIASGPGQTMIRTFTTKTPKEPIENTIQFFEENDEFDEILSSANIEGVTESKTTSNDVAQEIPHSLLINNDWADISWGSSGQKIEINLKQTTNVPTESIEHSSTSRMFQRNNHELDASHSSNIEAYQWGSSLKTSTSILGSSSVKCTGCNLPAQELTVKKDGPNKGRCFYKCSKQPPCIFFSWGNEELNLHKEHKKYENDEGKCLDIVSSDESFFCNCKNRPMKFIVNKDGPNKGRWFYGCADRNKSCGYFKWCEAELLESNRSFRDLNSSTSGRFLINQNTRINNHERIASISSNESKKRKCGICRLEGHTRSKCPRKSEFEI